MKQEKNSVLLQDSNNIREFYDFITSPDFYHNIRGLKDGLLTAIEWEIKGVVEY